MKNSWYINLFFVAGIGLLFSCHKRQVQNVSQQQGYYEPIRSPIFEKDSIVFFKASIYTYGKSLSGILGIRKQDADTLKVSFFTEMGVKFFDVLITHDSYHLVNCISQLSSPVIMETLVEDIRWVVLWNITYLSQPVRLNSDDQDILVQYEYRNNWITGKLNFSGLPMKITYSYGRKKIPKFDLLFEEYIDNLPRKVIVRHHKFDLKIHLTYFIV